MPRMPRRNRRSRRPRKANRARRGGRGVNTAVVRAANGFPDRMVTKVEFRQALTISSVYGSCEKVDYRLNSIYDPTVALGGHQPMWTDQYSALYSKYRVFSCKYEVKLVAISSQGTPMRVVTLASGQNPAALPTDIATAWEQNRTGSR